jgi:aryl-alcohol dehydrogenase-like predicted oxidoreductase
LEEAVGIANVDAIQPPFSLIHRDAADDVLLWAREHVTGVIVYSPMASGLLSGAFTAARAAALDPGDWRRGHPDFTDPALSANLARCHRRHRRRPLTGAGWRLAARRDPGAKGRRPGRDRRRHPGYQCRHRTHRA